MSARPKMAIRPAARTILVASRRSLLGLVSPFPASSIVGKEKSGDYAPPAKIVNPKSSPLYNRRRFDEKYNAVLTRIAKSLTRKLRSKRMCDFRASRSMPTADPFRAGKKSYGLWIRDPTTYWPSTGSSGQAVTDRACSLHTHNLISKFGTQNFLRKRYVRFSCCCCGSFRP